MRRNTELFDEIADVIEAHPESYNQGTWGCGSAFCVAGHAASLSGCKASTGESLAYIIPPEDDDTELPLDNDGEITLNLWASKKLGLDYREDRLFDSEWLPPVGMTVPEALRAIGRGADIE